MPIPAATLHNSISLRLVAGATVWIVCAVALTAFLLLNLFRDHVERTYEADLNDHVEELLILADTTADGKIALTRHPADPRFNQPLSGWYWVIAGEAGPGHAGTIRSRSLWDGELTLPPAPPPGKGQTVFLDGPRGERLRGLTRTVTMPGSDDDIVMLITGPAEATQSVIDRFQSTILMTLGTLGLGLFLAVIFQVVFGLRPLRRVRDALADIRAGRAARLESEQFPAEVKPLADEMNALLDHNAVVLERARTHVGNLAHALKTPLAVVQNDAAAADGPIGDSLRRQAEIMGHCINHHLRRARMAGAGGILGMRTDVTAVSESLMRTLVRLNASRALATDLRSSGKAWFRGERQDLEEMLGNLMENAFKWARGRIEVSIDAHDGRLFITVEDDGPGVPAEKRDAVLGRGRRLDESVPGSGLGLAIVRDLAEMYGGSIELDQSPFGGLSVALDLPAAESAKRKR